MQLRQNKPFRNLGVYTLRDKTLVLLKRTEALSFLFSFHNWQLHGPVEYRVSHGHIYSRGEPTHLTDEDLQDTGLTANPPRLYVLVSA
jgi:hypothetical protein